MREPEEIRAELDDVMHEKKKLATKETRLLLELGQAEGLRAASVTGILIRNGEEISVCVATTMFRRMA